MGKKFTGDLAIPRKPFKYGPLAPKDVYEKAAAEYIQVIDKKMELLLDAYEIPRGPAQWKLLAFRLAKEICPGLRDEERPGRRTSWGDMALGVLVVEIEREKKNGAKNAKSTAARLAKKEPWRSFLSHRQIDSEFAAYPDPGEVLRRNYARERRGRLAKLCRDLFAYYEATDNKAGWEQFVVECLKGDQPDPILSEGAKKKRK